MNKKITVIGAGNGGLTAAYHLSKNEFSVCIYDSPDFPKQINKISQTGEIVALSSKDGENYILSGRQNITLATTDIKEAMDFSDTFVMICPSFAQEILFSVMLPHLKKNDTVIVMPGNYAGLVLNNMLKQAGKSDLNITFVDAISIPWATRIANDGEIAIMGIKEFLPLSIFPKSNDNEKMRAKIESILPIPVEYLANPIVSGLENINFGGHPLMTTLNIGLLENFNGEFNYYCDCCSVSTAKAANKMDLERIAIANALGFSVRTELDAMNSLYNTNFETVYEFNRASKTHGKIKNAPNSAKNRYITEDVPYLLVPCYEFAKLCGVKCNLIESIIHIASAYNDTDYFKTGRTLEKMGINNLDEIKALLG